MRQWQNCFNFGRPGKWEFRDAQKSRRRQGVIRLQFSQLKRFLHARFSAEDVLGLHLTLGILVILAATWLFGAIAEDVINEERLTVIDMRVTRAVQAYASRPLTIFMLIITHLHSTLGGTLITLAVVAWFIRQRLKTWALVFSLSVGGGMLLNVLLKNLFQRARPTFDVPILTLTSYGFPSGHTILATTLYGALCAFIVLRVRSWFVFVLSNAFLYA